MPGCQCMMAASLVLLSYGLVLGSRFTIDVAYFLGSSVAIDLKQLILLHNLYSE